MNSPHASSDLSERLRPLALALEGRAKRLRVEALFFLVLIVMSLLAGGLAFVFAANITAIDIGRPRPLQEQIGKVEARLSELQVSLKRIDDETKTRAEPIQIRRTNQAQQHLRDRELADREVMQLTSVLAEKLLRNVQRFGPTHVSPEFTTVHLGVLPSQRRPGEYYVEAGTHVVYFATKKGGEALVKSWGSEVRGQIDELAKASERRRILTLSPSPSAALDAEIQMLESQAEVRKRPLNDEQEALRKLSTELVTQNLRERMLQSPSSVENSDATSLSISKLIQTNLTRFGGLLIIVFLVRVLLPQYQYNMKLASFYEARADAMKLHTDIPGEFNFENLANILTPKTEFGKEPEVAIAQAIEIVQLVLGKESKKEKASG